MFQFESFIHQCKTCHMTFCYVGLTLKLILEQAEQTASLLSELAEVVAQEKLLSDECLELCRTISTLEVINESFILFQT